MVNNSAWTNQLNEAQGQGITASNDVESQYDKALNDTNTQAKTAADKIRSDAEANRVTIRNSIGSAEAQIQSVLNQAREAAKKAQRRQVVGLGVTKVAMPDLSQLAGYQADLIKLRNDVNTAEGQSLDDIAKQVDAIKADLQSQKQSALSKIGETVSTNLANINKAYQDAQAKEDAQRIAQEAQANAIAQANAQRIAQANAFQISTVKLNTGEYVDAGIFNDLNLAQQNYLIANGIDKYNKRMAEYLSNVTVTSPVTAVTQPEYKPTQAEIDAANKQGAGYDEFTTPSMPTEAQQKVLGVKVTYGEPIKVNPPSYPQGNLQATRTPEDIAIIIKNIAQALTPWVEANGEDMGTYIKNLPANIPSIVTKGIKDYSTWYTTENDKYNYPDKHQAELKQEYDDFNASPLWQKLLTAGGVVNPVTIMPNGMYFKVKQGEVPMMSLASEGAGAVKVAVQNLGKVLKVANAADIGLSDAQYIRFINARVANPELSVEGFKAIDSVMDMLNTKGGATFAQQRAISMGEAYKGVIQPGIEDAFEGGSIVSKAISTADTAIDPYATDASRFVGKANWYQEVMDTLATDKSVVAATPKIEQAVANVSRVVTNPTISATEAVTTLINQGAVSVALATKPAETISMLASIAPELKVAAMAMISTKLSDAIDNNQSEASIQKIAQAEVVKLTNTSNKAITDSELATQLKPITSTAIKNMTVTVPEVVTQNWLSLEPQVDTQTKTKIQAKTELQPQTQTRLQAKPISKTEMQTNTETQTDTNTEENNRYPKDGTFKPIILPLPSGRSVELTQQEFDGIVAWKQGFIYILKYPNYDKAHTIHTRKPIAGVKYYSGIGSAVKSFIVKNGSIPHDLKFSMGIEDVTIRANKPQGQMLDFNLNNNYRIKNANKKAQNNSVLSVLRTVK